MGRWTTLAALAAACAFAPVASAAGPTHRDFVQQADFLCTMAAQQTNALGTPKTKAQAVQDLSDAIFIGQTLRTGTLAIPAPAKDRPLIRRGMAAMAVELTDLKHALAALRAGQTAVYNADVRKANAAHAKAVAAARKLGLKSCT